MNCYFCGQSITQMDACAFICKGCSVGYAIWDVNDPDNNPHCSSVYFIQGDYAVRLHLDEWYKNKTSLVKLKKIPGQRDTISTLLNLPYYVDVHPNNISYWIDRLKGMIPFS